MPDDRSSHVVSDSESRAVLMWRADQDDSRVEPSLQHAAEFLGVSGEAVAAAIESGEVLGDWFVDWDASTPAGGE